MILAVIAAASLQLGIGPTPAPSPAPNEVVLASQRVVVPMTYTRKRILIQAMINGAGPFTLSLNTNARLQIAPEALTEAKVSLVDPPTSTPAAAPTPVSAVTPPPPPKIGVIPVMDIEGVELKNIPVVARLAGTNLAEGVALLENAGIEVERAENLGEAASKAVAAAKRS